MTSSIWGVVVVTDEAEAQRGVSVTVKKREREGGLLTFNKNDDEDK